MDSHDLSLVNIGHEDDALLKNFPQDDAGGFISCSPLVIAGSVGSSRPPKTTMTKEKVNFGETGCLLPERNKENLQVSNTKLGSINLSMEPQKMKRSRKGGGCNLRKSLAWDKAFFTEEGVLSSLELSMISGTPSKLDGEELPTICEEQRSPMHTSAVATDLQTLESKLFRKMPSCNLRSDKISGEGSQLKQKCVASSSMKPKSLPAAARAKKGARKDGACSNTLAPASHKRLLSTSPAKPAAQTSKTSKIQVSKPDLCMIPTTANNLDAGHLKRTRIAPPASSAQKHLGPKVSSNTRSTSNAPKMVAQRIPRSSKPPDQRLRKNRTDLSAQEQPSASHQVPKVKEINSSEVNSDKKFPVGSEAHRRTSKAAVPLHANSDKTSIIGHSVQGQAARPSGLRMPSPSLRFFSEPKLPASNSARQRNIRPSNLPDPAIPISHNIGAAGHTIKPKIPKAALTREADSGSVQQCSVSSIRSPKIHDQSEQHKSNELSVGVQALSYKKPPDQKGNGILEDVDKHFLEHEQTSLSIEGTDGKDDRPVFHDRECKIDYIEMLALSHVQLKSHPEVQVEDIPGSDNNSDCHVKHRQHNLSDTNKDCRLGSAVKDSASICSSLGGSIGVENSTNGQKEAQELQVSFPVIDEVPQVYDGLSLDSEKLPKRSLSPERDFENDVVNSVTEEDKLNEPPAAEEAFSAPMEEIMNTVTKQQELQILKCPVPLLDQLALSADGSTLENDAFSMVTDEDKLNEPLPLEALSSSGFVDTKQQAEHRVGLSISNYSNEKGLVDQSTHFELQTSPMVCKSTSQIDAVNCDDKLSAQGTESNVELPSIYGSNQQLRISDELVREALLPYEATSSSIKIEPCLKNLISFDGRKLNKEAELHLNPSTISVGPLMLNEATSSSLRNEHWSEDLVSVDDKALSYQAECQLNPTTSKDQTVHATVFTAEGSSLENETMLISLEKDNYCKYLVSNDSRELTQNNHMEMLLPADKYGNQTADALAINDTEACSSPDGNQTASWPPSNLNCHHSSSPHGSSYASLPLKASKDGTTGVADLETDYQMKQEPSNHSLEIKQEVKNLPVLIDSRNDERSHDQTILKELPLSPRISEDSSRSSAANCDVEASCSPCKIKSSTMRKASKDESIEQYQSENFHGVFHNIGNEDTGTKTKLLKDGENQSQLVIRPSKDVPFSDEWLAAVEAAGEEILTLKTGPVQNSPPARSSPEPGPWSPVKRKTNQAIGPFDCTKFTTGQH